MASPKIHTKRAVRLKMLKMVIKWLKRWLYSRWVPVAVVADPRGHLGPDSARPDSHLVHCTPSAAECVNSDLGCSPSSQESSVAIRDAAARF